MEKGIICVSMHGCDGEAVPEGCDGCVNMDN